MKERDDSPIEVGEFLYQHTTEPQEPKIVPETQSVVYLGRTPESVSEGEGSGHIAKFQVVDGLGVEAHFGSREGWGVHNEFISMPSEVARETLGWVENQPDNIL